MGAGRDVRALLNLKQVASRLGVHYMTAYRYVRQGRLVGERVGTEWRVSEEALTNFTAVRAPAVGGAAAVGGPGDGVDGGAGGGSAGQWPGRLTRCLFAGDEAAAWRTVQAALAAGHSPAFCYVDMLGAALVSLRSAGVVERHVAAAVAGRVVARLGAGFRRPGRSRGTVVFGAPLGELEGLPVAIAADLVRSAGFDVTELGANVPAAVFADAAQQAQRLVGVGIGLTSPASLVEAQATIDAVRSVAADVPVVAGAWPSVPSLAGLTGLTAWVRDGREAMELFDRF